ncbi:MAG TPA: butyrate kinase [Clostridiaceae bacterium]|nr:butyrate kinase [Clostridiaceae bacterium]
MTNKEKTGYRIVLLNFGSTSSEVGFLDRDGTASQHKIRHDDHLLSLPVGEQLAERTAAVNAWLAESGHDPADIDAVVCRGGRIRPVRSGIYRVNRQLLDDSNNLENGDHAGRLSVLAGQELAQPSGCPVFVVDPISVDEFEPVARVSGLAGIERKSLGHMLNSKYVAEKAALELGIEYGHARMIVAHLGGGATISAHRNGRMVDLINDFEGALTPERSGLLPTYEIVNLCRRHDLNDVSRMLEGRGGFFSYLGTKDFSAVVRLAAAGNSEAKLLLQAYLYQNDKSIAAMLAVIDFRPDAFVLTGGIAHEATVREHMRERFGQMAPVVIYPGGFEFEALMENAWLALQGKKPVRRYPDGEVPA